MRLGGWKRYEGNKRGNMRFPIYNAQRAFVREGYEDTDDDSD